VTAMLFTAPAAPASAGVIPLFADVLRSEARKLRTVRSTWWALLAAVGCNIVTAALLGVFLPGRLSAHEAATADSVRISLGGLHLSQVAIGLLGFGLGAVFRSSAGAVAVLLGALFVPTILVMLLPQSWQDTVGPYLPMNAADTVFSLRHEAHTLQPWAGLGVFCLYAAAALAAGFILIGRRDA